MPVLDQIRADDTLYLIWFSCSPFHFFERLNTFVQSTMRGRACENEGLAGLAAISVASFCACISTAYLGKKRASSASARSVTSVSSFGRVCRVRRRTRESLGGLERHKCARVRTKRDPVWQDSSKSKEVCRFATATSPI
jgi:hypothetical protein